MHQTVTLEDTPSIRGMINKIDYMVTVEEAFTVPFWIDLLTLTPSRSSPPPAFVIALGRYSLLERQQQNEFTTSPY